MLQRNVSGGPLVLPTLDPPAHVFPGDTIEYDEPLAGFEIVTDENDDDQSTVVEPATVLDIPKDLPPPPEAEDDEPAAPSATTDEEATE